MTRRVQVLAVLILAALPTTIARAQEAPDTRPTVTIVEFETNRTGWVPPPHFGTTIADLLSDQLVASGRYRVMDQHWLAHGDDPNVHMPIETLKARARDAGVTYFIFGSVTQFSNEARERTVGGLLPLFARVPLVIGGGGRRSRTESIVGLTARVIDAQTGELLTTATAQGQSNRQKTSVLAIGLSGLGPLGGGVSNTLTGSRDAMLAESLKDAVASLSQQLTNPRFLRRPDASNIIP